MFCPYNTTTSTACFDGRNGEYTVVLARLQRCGVHERIVLVKQIGLGLGIRECAKDLKPGAAILVPAKRQALDHP